MTDNPYRSPEELSAPLGKGATPATETWPGAGTGLVVIVVAVIVMLLVRRHALSLPYGDPSRSQLLNWTLALGGLVILAGFLMLVCGSAVWLKRKLTQSR